MSVGSPVTAGSAPLDPLGILKSEADGVRSSAHFEVGDSWQTVLVGEEQRRPKSLTRVAITRAEIEFGSEDDFTRFLKIITASDERLRKISDDEVMYDWQQIRRKGMVVRFGVAWYDDEFYQSRKDAYLSELHSRVFAQFAVAPNAIRIEHIPL